jgi:hypothetical protein
VTNGVVGVGVYSGPGVSGTNFTPSVAGPGTHTVVYTFTTSSNCVASNSIQVVVSAKPAAPVSLGDVVTCAGVPAMVAVSNLPATVVVYWYDEEIGGVPKVTGTNAYWPDVTTASTNTYYAEARDLQADCVSASRTPVTLAVQDCPRYLTINLQNTNTILEWFGNLGLQYSSSTNSFAWTNLVQGLGGFTNRWTNEVKEGDLMRLFRLYNP